MEREKKYEQLSKDCPKVFQEAFKHTSRGRLDKAAHHWLVPRVRNYYGTESDGRSGVLDRIIRDLIHEFPDLHPNFLKLKDSSMEKEYLASLRNVVSVAASGIKAALGNPSKFQNIDKDVVKFLTGNTLPPRAHDLWAKFKIKQAKEAAEQAAKREKEQPCSEPIGSRDQSENELEKPFNYPAEWDQVYAGHVKTHGKKFAANHRLKFEQDFRTERFDQLPTQEKKIWEEQAAKLEKPFDRLDIIASGMPFMNHVFKRFAEIAEVPMLVILGAPDFQNPREVVIYQ